MYNLFHMRQVNMPRNINLYKQDNKSLSTKYISSAIVIKNIKKKFKKFPKLGVGLDGNTEAI